MKMFLPSGYINMPDLIDNEYPFLFITGARGTGKTYGGLLHIYDKIKTGAIHRFLYLRRTQVEIDAVADETMNPFKKINIDKGLNVTVKPIRKNIYGFYDDDGLIGYAAALSTFRNLRSFDFSDVDVIFYDEFIPEANARPIKNEATTLLNIYESVNRNRELDGEDPVKLVCASNSNEMGNPVYMELGVISKIERIAGDGGGTLRDPERGLMIVLLKNSPISARKRETALYKLSGDTQFSAMALNNEFQDNDRDAIKSQALREYKSVPVVTLDGVAIYEHKSRNEYYACQYSGEPQFTTKARDIERFNLQYWFLWNRYIDGELNFQNYLTKRIFLLYNKAR